MAFNQRKLDKSVEQSRGIFNEYIYATDEDTIAEVSATGYFEAARFAETDIDWVGSFITCKCTDGNVTGQIGTDGTITPVASGSDPVFTTLTEGQVPRADDNSQLVYAGATVDTTSNEWTFDAKINAPQGSVGIGEVMELSEGGTNLVIADLLSNSMAFSVNSFFDDSTGASGPTYTAFGAPFVLNIQTDDTQVITTNPLTYSLTSTVVSPDQRLIDKITYRANGAMTNVSAEFVDNATGEVIKYFPSKAAFDGNADGLTLIAGDNTFFLTQNGTDTPGNYYLGFTPLILTDGQQIDVTIKGDTIDLLGDVSDVPYQVAEAHDGEPTTLGSGTGDVVGPPSSIDNELAVFDGGTGTMIQGGSQITAAPGTDASLQLGSTATAGSEVPALSFYDTNSNLEGALGYDASDAEIFLSSETNLDIIGTLSTSFASPNYTFNKNSGTGGDFFVRWDLNTQTNGVSDMFVGSQDPQGNVTPNHFGDEFMRANGASDSGRYVNISNDTTGWRKYLYGLASGSSPTTNAAVLWTDENTVGVDNSILFNDGLLDIVQPVAASDIGVIFQSNLNVELGRLYWDNNEPEFQLVTDNALTLSSGLDMQLDTDGALDMQTANNNDISINASGSFILASDTLNVTAATATMQQETASSDVSFSLLDNTSTIIATWLHDDSNARTDFTTTENMTISSGVQLSVSGGAETTFSGGLATSLTGGTNLFLATDGGGSGTDYPVSLINGGNNGVRSDVYTSGENPEGVLTAEFGRSFCFVNGATDSADDGLWYLNTDSNGVNTPWEQIASISHSQSGMFYGGSTPVTNLGLMVFNGTSGTNVNQVSGIQATNAQLLFTARNGADVNGIHWQDEGGTPTLSTLYQNSGNNNLELTISDGQLTGVSTEGYSFAASVDDTDRLFQWSGTGSNGANTNVHIGTRNPKSNIVPTARGDIYVRPAASDSNSNIFIADDTTNTGWTALKGGAIYMWGNNGVNSGTTTRFLDPGGNVSTGAGTDENNARLYVVTGGHFRDFRVTHGNPNGNGNLIEYTFAVNGVTQGGTVVTLASTGDSAGNTDFIKVNRGDYITVHVTKVSSVNNSPNEVRYLASFFPDGS